MTQKIALVTGGMGGIGTAICKRLAEAGHRVVTTYSTPGKHADWQARMREQGFDIATYQCDVSNFDSCASMVKRVRDELGPVGILVNNAGITRDGRMQKMEKSAWDDVLRTNLDSVFNVTRQVLDDMCEANWGRVINISSINGQKGQFGQTNYSAAKAGVHGFSMALAQEVAKKRHHGQHHLARIYWYGNGDGSQRGSTQPDHCRHSGWQAGQAGRDCRTGGIHCI